MFKKKLTGNLNAPVNSVPPFPGKERHYLRAQLARLQHTTQLVPKDLFVIDEETNAQKFNEEYAVPDLKSLENWSHLHPLILKAGRCTILEPVGMDDEAKEEYMNKANETDPTKPRFNPANEDSEVQKQPAWTTKSIPDYNINIVRSVRWPGAVVVEKGGKFCNIYVGDLCKNGDSFFNPTEPPAVLGDPNDPEE